MTGKTATKTGRKSSSTRTKTKAGRSRRRTAKRSPEAIFEEIAASVMLVEPHDKKGLATVKTHIEELESIYSSKRKSTVTEKIRESADVLSGVIDGKSKNAHDDLEYLINQITEIQRMIRDGSKQGSKPRAKKKTAKEQGTGDTTPEEASKAAEPEGANEPAESIEPAENLESKEKGQEAAAPARTSVPEKTDRDEETIELIADFLEESEEGLTRADQILMDSENCGFDAENVNALFRVFHTIKGVAGFLDFNDIMSLAHKTETMLNMVRDNKLELAGVPLDLTFDSTALMRRMMKDVHTAVANCVTLVSPSELPLLQEKIQAVIDGKPIPGSNTPEVSRGKIEPVEPGDDAESIAGKAGEDQDGGIDDSAGSTPATTRNVKKEPRSNACRHVQVKETVRVDADRLDRLLETIGELVIAESMVSQADEVRAGASSKLGKDLNRLDKITRELQDIGLSLRMVPVRGVFQKMARLARDLSRKSGKQLEFFTSGDETEIDKSVVDKLGDPLVHMIRNAVDHGLESAEQRTAAGKPAKGAVRLSASHRGGNIYIQIEDDGKGLDREVILAKAIERGIVQEGDQLSDKEVYNLIFEPGFSTAKKVTNVSGRGVGMDVVRRNIEELRGAVDITSEPGKGSTFTIRLPLTLAIIEGMVISVGGQRFIIPTLSIIRSFRPTREDISTAVGRAEMVSMHGELIPLFRLHELFDMVGAVKDPTGALIVVVEDEGHQIGLLVDELLGQQQIVIKSLDSGMEGAKGVAGAAIMSDGEVSLILNIGELVLLANTDTSKELIADFNDKSEKEE